MDSAQRDVLDLFEYAAGRLLERMAGLTDDEWAWRPVAADPDVTIRWRLDHLVDTLTDDRNRVWLGLVPSPTDAVPPPPDSASAALEALSAAVSGFSDLVRTLDDAAAEPIGAVAGEYGAATRRSFVLHVVDELVHHGAEAALIRDLYAAR